MHVDRDRIGVDAQPLDPGFLAGLPQCGRTDIGIVVLAVPAELQPTADTRM